MKYIYSFALLSILFSLCDGRENQNSTIDAPHTILQPLNPDTSLQIGEYVVEVFEDNIGNLWFGTMSGAVLYPCAKLRAAGKKLTYFTTKDGLCDNIVVSIAQDRDGNIWFGTHAGASKYDGKTFTSFTESKGIHGPGCKILVDKNGNIWAGTNHGAFRYNGSSFSEFAIPKPDIDNFSFKWEAGKIWDLKEDHKGNIWFARDGYGACKYDGKSFIHFTKKDGLCSNNVSSIVEDKHGNIWFGSLTSDFPENKNEGGINKYDGKTFTSYPEIKALTKNDIYTIYEDSKGNIWIGATGYGAYRYDGNKFTLFNTTDRPGLIINFSVQAILEDSNGSLWFGFSGGLFRFNGNSFTNVRQDGPWN